MREALQRAPPRPLDGSAAFLSRARLPFRIGVAGAALFCLPFFIMTLSDPAPLPELVGSLVGLLLFWLLPPVVFLRLRMRYLDRLWREGLLVPGVLRLAQLARHPGAPAATTPGRFIVSFTTPEGETRLAQFLGTAADFPEGR